MSFCLLLICVPPGCPILKHCLCLVVILKVVFILFLLMLEKGNKGRWDLAKNKRKYILENRKKVATFLLMTFAFSSDCYFF
jgi:hypothetical protein